MILLDTNILVYAHIPDMPQHDWADRWLTSALASGKETIGLGWHVLNAFFRVTTNRRIFENPMGVDKARKIVDELLNLSLVHQLHTTNRHWKILSAILDDTQVEGDDVMDAHIAALAVEHGAAGVATADKGFNQFSDFVKIIDPRRELKK